MEQVEIIDEDADLPPEELGFDVASYKRSMFGMFSGETTAVTLVMQRSLIDVVFDLFGEEIKIVPHDEKTVRFTANVQVSALFFGWCGSFGEKVKLLGPKSVVEQFKEYMDSVGKQYAE